MFLNNVLEEDDINDDDDYLRKVCVVEAPANEENELDTLLLLGQVFLMKERKECWLRHIHAGTIYQNSPGQLY